MVGDLKPYPEYKDSNVPWLGRVPVHWEVHRFKRIAKLNPSKSELPATISDDELVTFLPMERVGGDGLVDVRNSTSISMVRNGFTYFRRGDVILAKITPCFENGKGACLDGLPTEIGFGSTEFHVLRALKSVLPQFLYRTTTLPEFRDLGTEAMTGAAGQQRVPQSFVANFQVALPPLPEQLAIICYLGHMDRVIRHHIRAKQKLIKLFEEQKHSIIDRAVTRGIDPTVRLKPSGVEWLGDVPEHWQIRRNGRLFAQRNETGFSELPILEVSLKTGIRIRNFETSIRKQVMSDRDKYKRAVSGDIAYNMMRMWQGAVGVAPTDGLVSPAYVVARPLHGVHSQYFSYLFRTAAYMSEVDKYSRGIVKDRNRLYWEDFKQMPSPFPPPDEQVRIADAIEEHTRMLNVAINRANRGIDLVREYRTRLIADVVTGKLDVREAAAQVPEPEPADALDHSEMPTESEAYADDVEITDNEGVEEVTANDAVDA